MIIKFLEIRDEATCIPVMAIQMLGDSGIQYKYLWREGYPLDGSSIVLMRLSDQEAHIDPFDWSGRTMPAAHSDILSRFSLLSDGQVIDVRVFLKEQENPVEAEIWTEGI